MTLDPLEGRGHRTEGLERVVPGQQQQQRGDQQREQQRADRGGGAEQDPAGPRAGHQATSPTWSSPAPVIAAPSCSGGHRPRVVGAGQPPAQDHGQPVGHPDQLLQVGRDQQHRKAGRPGGAQVLPDRRLRTDVDAAGRVRGDQQHRVLAHLPADDQLLLIAAGQRRRGDVDARASGRRRSRRCVGCRPWPPPGPAGTRGTTAAGSGGRESGSPRAIPPGSGPAGAGPPG